MCIDGVCIGKSKHFKLIVGANRDEYLDRPALPAKFWEEEEYSHIYAGKDLKKGGSWLGISKYGRFAMLTNCWHDNDPNAEYMSRGKIVLDVLEGKSNLDEFSEELMENCQKYDYFNVIYGDLLPSENNSSSACCTSCCCGEMLDFRFASNSTKTDASRYVRTLTPGIHVISNASLDTPWPKATHLHEDLQCLIDKHNENIEMDTKQKSEIAEELFTIMRNPRKFTDYPASGIFVTKILIDGRPYGTRTTTVMLVTHNNVASIWERNYDQDNGTFTETFNELRLSPKESEKVES